MKEAYVVVIGWVSPRGTYPTRQQLLALAPEVAEGQPYFKYQFNDLYDETYFFERSEDARAFKSRIEESYNKNPQYFVIDDEGNVANDEAGNPRVAWMPEVHVELRELDPEET